MKIEFLKEYASFDFDSHKRLTPKPMPLSEIEALEQQYNNGNPYPKVVRELLLISGKGGGVLSLYAHEIQGEVRNDMQSYNPSRVIGRPFFAFEFSPDIPAFYMVYTDEGVDDPLVYTVHYDEEDIPEMGFITPWGDGMTLSGLASFGIQSLKDGRFGIFA